MEWAYLGLAVVSVLCGYVGALGRTWVLSRRSRMLELRVQDLEERQLKVTNREKSEKRWARERSFEEEAEALGLVGQSNPRQQRFSNDVLEGG